MKKKFQKRNTIILSALKLFSKKGFYNTTISEISKNMDISIGSIYNYFPSKKSLAKASIKFVTGKLATELRFINNQTISQKEKIRQFVNVYFVFIQKNPEMIEYFFRVYLSNRELFCDEEDCGFSLAKEFIDEIEKLINDGIILEEFKEIDFYVTFSLISGILGAMTFLSGEHVLKSDLSIYTNEVSNTIYKALSC